MCQIITLEDLLKQINQPEFEIYNETTIDILIELVSGKNGFLISSYAQELVYKYIDWLKIQENNITYRLKDNFNFYFNYITVSVCNRLRVRRPILCNFISNYFSNNIMTSMKVIDKLKESRNKIKLFDEELKNNKIEDMLNISNGENDMKPILEIEQSFDTSESQQNNQTEDILSIPNSKIDIKPLLEIVSFPDNSESQQYNKENNNLEASIHKDVFDDEIEDIEFD